MSTLSVDNIDNLSGNFSAAMGQILSGWCNYDGTGVISIRDSLNVSSLTDNGAGYYSVNINNAMADILYKVSGSTNPQTGNDYVFFQIHASNLVAQDIPPTTTTFANMVYGRTTTANDVSRLSVDFQGNLA